MKKIIFALLLTMGATGWAQVSPFRFAFVTDLHIGSPNGAPEEDLRRTVRDIVAMDDIASQSWAPMRKLL
jgi:hypothetical protein